MRDQYTNPVINSDFPDPDIIRVGDTYYMARIHSFPTRRSSDRSEERRVGKECILAM